MHLWCVDKTQPWVTLPKGICFVASVFCICNTIMLFELPIMHGFSRKNSPNHLDPPSSGRYSYVIWRLPYRGIQKGRRFFSENFDSSLVKGVNEPILELNRFLVDARTKKVFRLRVWVVMKATQTSCCILSTTCHAARLLPFCKGKGTSHKFCALKLFARCMAYVGRSFSTNEACIRRRCSDN